MIELTPNLFSTEWIDKYGLNSIQKYSQFMKEYKNTNYSYSFYLNFQDKIKDELKKKNKYNLQHFSIIFESFFPIFQKNVEFDMMMMPTLHKNSKSKIKNIIHHSHKTHLVPNYQPSFNITLHSEENKNLLFVEWKDTSNSQKKIKYVWGSKQTFHDLISRLPIPFDFQHQNNLQPLSIYSHHTSKLIDIIDSIIHFKFITTTIAIPPSLSLQLQSILKKLKKNKNIQIDIHSSLIQELYQFIIDYINQYIQMDIYFIKRIRLYYQSLAFYEKIRDISSSFHFEEIDFPKLLGKKYTYQNDRTFIQYAIKILRCMEILYRSYLFSQLTYQDYIYSILWNQMNPFILQNEKIKLDSFFKEDIEEYFIFKENWYSSTLLKEINYEEPFLMKTGLFIDIPYKVKYPKEPLLQIQLAYSPQLIKSHHQILSSFLKKLSLSKKYQEYNVEYQNLFDYYLQSDKNKFQWKKYIPQISKIQENEDNIKKIEYQNYFQIYEDISLNVLGKRVQPTKYAYCTLLYGNNQYSLDAITFGYSLYMSGTSYDRIILCTKDVPLETKKQLSRFYNRIFIINELEVDDKLFLTKNRWYGVFNKIYAFYLDEYEKILLTDTDMLIQRTEEPVHFTKYPSYCELDVLFEKVHTPAGMCYHENYITTTNEKIAEKIFDEYSKEHKSTISAGMLLIEPSKDIFYDMIYKLHPNTQTDFVKVPCKFPEEGFLSQYFKGEWYTLSAIYNFAPIWLDSDDFHFKQKEKLSKIKEEDIVVIHYGGYKPWIYIKSPQWLILEESIKLELITKMNIYWYLQFIELEELCSLPSEGIIAESIPSLRNYCNWDDIKFY